MIIMIRWISKSKSDLVEIQVVFLAPLLYCFYYTVILSKLLKYLWWTFCWFQDSSCLDEMFNWLFSCDYHLEDSQNTSSQGIFIVIFRINFLESLECFNSVIEMSHFVTVISNELQKIIGISWCFSWDIDIPCVFRFTIHDVSPDQPLDVSFFTFVLLVSEC